MLSELFAKLLHVPYLRKRIWHGWYQFLARSYRGADWTFMNYGFVDESLSDLKLEQADEKDRYCIQLYNHVAGTVELEGKRVLEVGCGRGGGASFIARYLKPGHMTGADLSAEAVAFCRNTHVVPGLEFQVGDAEHLPFDDASFDVVVNVESSHCYPSLAEFFKEVHRVLKPGGFFLYADLHENSGLSQWQSSLAASGFKIIHQTDITKQVLTALDADNERKVALIRRFIPPFLRPSFFDFAGIRGSKIYEAFRSQTLIYASFVAQKIGQPPRRFAPPLL